MKKIILSLVIVSAVSSFSVGADKANKNEELTPNAFDCVNKRNKITIRYTDLGEKSTFALNIGKTVSSVIGNGLEAYKVVEVVMGRLVSVSQIFSDATTHYSLILPEVRFSETVSQAEFDTFLVTTTATSGLLPLHVGALQENNVVKLHCTATHFENGEKAIQK